MRERFVREGSRARRWRGGRRVLRSDNAVHSLRHRVLSFLAGGVRRRVMELEYRALRYGIVYVGAIAVLLRFVVMLLNVTEWAVSSVLVTPWGMGRLVRALSWFIFSGVSQRLDRYSEQRGLECWVASGEPRPRMGQLMYTEGFRWVWLAGMVRRVARRGAVQLTREEGSLGQHKRQWVSEQLARSLRR